MQSRLRENICSLESSGTYRTDIDPQYIRHYLPPELQYSYRYSIYHLEQSQDLFSGIEDVLLFLQKHFLHWLEAMSLLGFISDKRLANGQHSIGRWAISAGVWFRSLNGGSAGITTRT
jgi:hypothetical protein